MGCLIGKLTGGPCGNRIKKKLDEDIFASLQLFQINHLEGDLSQHFSTTEQVCQNVRLKENWMIKWDLRDDVPQRGTIYWKHGDYYNSKFRIR